jgi:imidazolonepropionase-like amidohydrolase
MVAWRFDGVLLPDGEEGEVVVGEGEATDLPGRWAVTGLVDAHCHFTVDVGDDGLPYLSDAAFAQRRLEGLARDGVTLLRDVGGRSEVTLDYARSTRPGLPLVLAAGRFHSTADRYFPRMYTPCDPDDLDESIRTEVATGATWIKVIADFPEVVDGRPASGTVAPTYDEETLARAVATAHDAGARVAAHCGLSATALVAMGVDSIEHGNGLTEDDLRLLGSRGGAWTPTIAVATRMTRGSDEEAPVAEHYRHHLPLALGHGVTVMTGSDAMASVAEDVAVLAEHGLTVEQAIAAATTAPRAYLGVESASDLVTFETDPRDDPAVLAIPSAVVIRGERIV